MTLLAQQELVEPAPTRRLIVPQQGLIGTSVAWWGCDPSTRGVALSGVSKGPDGYIDRWVSFTPFRASEGGQRLSEIYRETRRKVESHAVCVTWPGIVFVEQPSGKFDKPTLSYAVGVTMAAIYDGLEAVTGWQVHVETVTSSAWKKRACGRGNIYKPKRGDGEYGVLTWARENGYTGSSWDCADAWAIAEAARRTVALEVR